MKRHPDTKRQPRDFYPTPPEFTHLLMRHWQPDSDTIWEPANGDGAMSDVLETYGYNIIRTDIDTGQDFLLQDTPLADTIITNPPFSLTTDFALQATKLAKQTALLLGLHFLGGHKRAAYLWQKYPPSRVLVIPQRMRVMTVNGVDNSQFNHMWVIWDRNTTNTTIEWTNL